MYGSPEGVRRLARVVGEGADVMRRDAARSAEATDVQWQSLRANRFREQLAHAAGAARSTAAELDELEQALLAHAAAVARTLEQIAAAERWLHGLVTGALNEAQHLAAAAARAGAHVLDVAGDAANSVVDGVTGLVSQAESTAEQGARAAQAAAKEAARAAADRAEHLQRGLAGVPTGDLRWIGLAKDQGWSW